MNAEAYYGDYPWRESGELHHPHLLRVIREGGGNAGRALRPGAGARVLAGPGGLERPAEPVPLGGHPSWMQSADSPHCPECLRFMPFLVQLDATLPGGDGTEPACYEGACYGFWCGRCRVSAFTWQAT